MLKIVFMGTPAFAVPALQSLITAAFDIPLVISQPDRKKGRGHKVQHTPVKELAISHDIEVYQPESIRTEASLETLKAVDADFFVVIAYGKILPESVLNIPGKACINVHASLLPKWRGAAPIQFSLLAGDRETGVCTMLMDKGMDTGDLLLTRKTPIDPDETSGELSERLAAMGGELIVETLKTFDEITPTRQDHEKASYTRLLKKEDRFIDWQQEAEQIYNQFRAFMPAPGVVTTFRGKRLLVKGMQVIPRDQTKKEQQAGEIVDAGESGLDIACASGAIRITSCQPESKKEMSAREFINGYQVKTGDRIGDKN